MSYESEFYEKFMGDMKSQENESVKDSETFTEAYLGKMPEFERVSALFDKMLLKAKEDPKNMNPNKWKENEEICKIFAKVFGLKSVWFYWIPHDMRNAFTVTVRSFLMVGDSKEMIVNRPGKGFYDTSHKSVFTIYGYCGLLLPEAKMTGRELCAIFLHELGHNFDYSPYLHVGFLMKAIINANGSSIEQNNRVKEDYHDQVLDEYDYLYYKNSTRDKIRKRYEKAMKEYFNSGAFRNFMSFVANTLSVLMCLPIAPLIQISDLEAHKGEQFADSFATAYGYGPDLISGLEKLGKYDHIKITNNDKTTVFFRDLNNCMYEILSSMIECHGTNQERCKECIKKLRNDLKTGDYPKGMKEDIEDEINRLEQTYNVLITSTPDDKEKITKAWRRLCDKLFGGAFNVAKWFKPNQM